MASERYYVQACERAQAVLAALTALGLAPTPDNFRICVWGIGRTLGATKGSVEKARLHNELTHLRAVAADSAE